MTKQDELQEEFIRKGIEFFKDNDEGYYNLAMRVGKCRITIEILKGRPNYDDYIPKVLIAYPDNKLRSTWEEECIKWDYYNPLITYTNFSSLKKYTEELWDFFVIDEFHSCSPNEKEICEQIILRSSRVLGLSGTVSESTKNSWNLQEIASYSTLDGISDNILANYQITVHIVDLDDKIQKKDKKGKLKTEKQKYAGYTWIIEKLKRENKPYMMLALARNRLSMSSIAKMAYLKALLAKLSSSRVIVFTGLSKVADEAGIPSYHSKSKNDDSFTEFQEGRHNHLALAAMGKVGVTYPNLDSVILLNFTYNAEESSQILNRAIKLDYNGKIADLHIICLNEAPELKKIKESLKMLDPSKIKYI
jgi:superfamily II DNA or RNA helicase